MLSLRRSTLRILSSSPSSFAYKPRSVTTFSSSTLTYSKPYSQFSLYQRRWATTEAEAKSNGEDAPISHLQPTPEEEVENAIKTNEAESTASEPVNTEVAASEAAPRAAHVAQSVSNDGTSVRGDVVFNPGRNQSRGILDAHMTQASRHERMSEPKETLYIGNLFFDVTEEDLSRELSRFGKIKKCRLLRDSRGLSKGFGYVDFEAVESATAAINAMHQQLYEGRRLVVQYAAFTTEEMDKRRSETQYNREGHSGPKNPPSKTLFIGNMSFEMTDRDLNNLFRGIRNVVDVRVAIDRRTGQPRGFAHADFTDIQSAMEAMKVLTEKETYGRRLRIDYSFGNSSAPRNQGVPPQRS